MTPHRYGVSSASLSNGLTVILAENRELPLVTCEIAIKAGACIETDDFNGLSHLYEHMFFKANAGFPSQPKLMERFQELGARWNGSTGQECVHYFLTVHRDRLAEALSLLRDAIRFPLFLEDEFLAEKKVILSEFDRYEADPRFLFDREIDKQLWWKYFSRKNTLGTRAVIESATVAQMEELQARYYLPENSALILGGDVSGGEAMEMAEVLFGDWENGVRQDATFNIPEHPPVPERRRIAVTKDVTTAELRVSWHGPGVLRDPKAALAADLWSTTVGQRDSSFQEALVESGLADSAGISYYSLVHTGPITFYAVTSPKRVDDAWGAMNDELARWSDPEYVSEEQLETAKATLSAIEQFRRERTSEYCHTLAFCWCTCGLDAYLDYVDDLKKISRADLTEFVNAYIVGTHGIEAALMSEQDLADTAFGDKGMVSDPMAVAPGTEASPPRSPQVAKGSRREIAYTPPPSLTVADSTEGARPPATENLIAGIPVVHRHIPDSEILSVEFVLLGGLPFFGSAKAGWELTLLNTLDKGTGKYSKDEISKLFARTGARRHTEAYCDYSSISLQMLSRDAEEIFPVLADLLGDPLLNEEELDRARMRRISLARQQQEMPDSKAFLLASSRFYADHPYEIRPAGSPTTLECASLEDLAAIHSTTFTRARMKAFVVGDIDLARLTGLFKQGFSGIPEGAPCTVAAAAQTPSARAHCEAADLPTNYIYGLFQAPNPAHDDFNALRVAIAILHNRFFDEVRTKRSLSYAPAARLAWRRWNHGQISVSTNDPDAALTVMFTEMKRMRHELVSEETLRNKVSELLTGDLIGQQASMNQARRLSLYDIIGGGFALESGAVKSLRAVTPDAIQEMCMKYFDNIALTLLGPEHGASLDTLAGELH